MKISSATKFILAIFAFSWVCWGIAISTGQPGTTFPTVIFYMLGGSGPTLVALFYLFRYFDRDARREFWSRLISPGRIHPFGWVACLFGMPVLIVLAVTLDVLLGGEVSPMPNLQMLIAQPVAIPLFVLMMLVGGALSEELGWRGMVLEAFQTEWSPLRSSLSLSLIWWTFHLPLFFLPGTTHHNWGLLRPMFWVFLLNVIPLTALLTLAYNHNQRSILSAVLIHFSYNLTLAVVDPISIRAYAITAIFLFLAVGVILNLRGWAPDTENISSGKSVLYPLPAETKP